MDSICLVVCSLEMQRKLILTKVHYKFLFSVSKETTHKPSKVKKKLAKNFSSSVHVIDTDLLRSMLFIPFDNWKSILFVKVFRYFSRHIVAFFETSILKEVRILRISTISLR